MTHKTEKVASTNKNTTKVTALSWDMMVELIWDRKSVENSSTASKAYHIFTRTSPQFFNEERIGYPTVSLWHTFQTKLGERHLRQFIHHNKY